MATTARIETRKVDGREVKVFVTETVLAPEAPLSKSRKTYLLASYSGPTSIKMAGGIPVDLSLTRHSRKRR